MYIGLSYFSVSLYSLNLSICISSCLSYSTLTLFFLLIFQINLPLKKKKNSEQGLALLTRHPTRAHTTSPDAAPLLDAVVTIELCRRVSDRTTSVEVFQGRARTRGSHLPSARVARQSIAGRGYLA